MHDQISKHTVYHHACLSNVVYHVLSLQNLLSGHVRMHACTHVRFCDSEVIPKVQNE